MLKWVGIVLICAAVIGLCLNLLPFEFRHTQIAIEQTSQAADIIKNDFTTIQAGLDIFRRLFFYEPDVPTRMFKRRALAFEIQTTITNVDEETGETTYKYINETYTFTSEEARDRSYNLLVKTLYPRGMVDPDNWFESVAQDVGVILSMVAYFFSVMIFGVYLVLDIAGVGWNLVLVGLSILRIV